MLWPLSCRIWVSFYWNSHFKIKIEKINLYFTRVDRSVVSLMISQYFQVLAYLFYPKNNTLQEGAEWTQVELQLGHFELGLSFYMLMKW